MNELLVFVWIASAITVAIDQVNAFCAASIEQVYPTSAKIKWGVFASLTFSFWAIFSYQTGLLYNIGIGYTNVYFKYFDLTITALMTSGGSAIVYEWINTIKSSKSTINSNNPR